MKINLTVMYGVDGGCWEIDVSDLDTDFQKTVPK